MARPVLAWRLDHGHGRLDDNIHQARMAHAEQLSASLNVHDAALLRLKVLRDELAPLLIENAEARRLVNLTLVPGDPPRLWIDMTSYVVMAPNPGTYRLQRDGFCRQETLLQSESLEQTVEAALRHVASHLVEREKQLQLVAADGGGAPAFVAKPHPPLLLAWLSGLTIGISLMAALLSWALR